MDLKKKRGANASQKQKQLLVEFIKQKPQLISSKQTQNYTFKDAVADWKNISNVLNSSPGANKDWKGWRKTWQDLRSRTKTKEGKNKTNARSTGGGPLEDDPLTNVEEEVLEIIKKVSVEGHDVDESNVSFDFELPAERLENLKGENRSENEDFWGLVETENISHDTSVDEVFFPPQTKRHCSRSEVVPHDVAASTVQHSSTSKNKANIIDKQVTKTRIPKKRNGLINSADAASSFDTNLKAKLSVKQNYYHEKLDLMKQSLGLKEKKVKALESIAKSLKMLTKSKQM